MDLITDPTAAASDPGVPTLTGTRGWFTGGTPGVTSATRVRYWWLNMLVNELLALLAAAGITPSPTTQNQVLTAIQTLGRIKLTANLNLFVNASAGSDSNNGLTSGTAWETLQHAANVISSTYDFNGFSVIVNCAGAFTAGVISQVQNVGSGSLIFDGGGTATVTATDSCCFTAFTGASIIVRNFGVLQASGSASGQGSILQSNSGNISVENVTCGPSTQAQFFAFAGSINALGGYSIAGGASSHVLAASNGVIVCNGVTIELSGTPAFPDGFAAAEQSGSLNMALLTFGGSGATGPRFSVSLNGTLYTAGAQATPTTAYLPGSLAGLQTTGGEYG